jgi:putative NIF3 family GTP cyclohydrolase 1 type 2
VTTLCRTLYRAQVTGMSRLALSRRHFARLAGAAALAGPPLVGQHAPLTAQEVIDRIQKNAGVPWQPQTLDTFKAGDPATLVKGIATTAMATMDVLTRAHKENINLVITLEPTFFGRLDAQPVPASAGGRGQSGVSLDDPVYLGKKEFIQKNGLVIWRFTDHWRARKPDPIATGLAGTLGWKQYRVGDDPFRLDLPIGTLESLADTLKKRLKARAGIRVVGDPQTRVRRIALLPGLSPLAATMKSLPESDVVLAGETREWESVEYAADTVAAGRKKGMIMLGRVVSEDPGMNICAEWLRTLVHEVPVRWLPAGDPYWRPA